VILKRERKREHNRYCTWTAWVLSKCEFIDYDVFIGFD